MAVLHLLLLLATLLLPLSHARKTRARVQSHPSARAIQVFNDSGSRIDMRWIHPQTKALAASDHPDGAVFGSRTGINSYIGHRFQVDELPNQKTGKCRHHICRKGYLVVNENEDQVFTVNQDFSIDVEDHKTRAMKKAKESTQVCRNILDVDELAECLERQINATMTRREEEIDFERSVRRKMSGRLASYACQDPHLNTTAAVRNTTIFNGQTAQILFESAHNALYLVENLLTPSQCESLLGDAVGNDERKVIPLSAKTSTAPTAVNVMEGFVSEILELPVEYHSDPMFMVQYWHGQGQSQDCVVNADGVCLRPPSEVTSDAPPAGDAASLRVVCAAPESGGHLLFPRAGVQVRPRIGQALLSLYASPDGQREVDGFLEEYVHCPVEQGDLAVIVIHHGY